MERWQNKVAYLYQNAICRHNPSVARYIYIEFHYQQFDLFIQSRNVFPELVFFVFLTILTCALDGVLNYISYLLNQKNEQVYEISFLNKLDELPLSFLDSSEGKNVIDEVSYVKSTATSYYKIVIANMCIWLSHKRINIFDRVLIHLN